MKTSFESVEALLHELSVEEKMALLDSDNRPKLKKFLQGLQPILTLTGTITVRLAEEFNKYDFFKVNTEKDAPVKISCVSRNFKELFLAPSASETVPGAGLYRTPGIQSGEIEVALHYYTLNKGLVDGLIIHQLGGKAKVKTTLAEVAACMQKQANGEPGALLNNGYVNVSIFYVPDTNGILRAVVVYGNGVGWGVDASSIENPLEWNAGYRAFSRDS